MKCVFCGSDTKEWVKVGNVYVIIHHFCNEQAKDNTAVTSAIRGASHKKKH
jgi:hypothetical protein